MNTALKKTLTTLVISLALGQWANARVLEEPKQIGIVSFGIANRETLNLNKLAAESLTNKKVHYSIDDKGVTAFGSNNFVRPGSIIELERPVTLLSEIGIVDEKRIAELKIGQKVRVLSYEMNNLFGVAAVLIEVID